MPQTIYSNIEAKARLKNSLKKVSDIVKSSYGPGGRKSILDRAEASNPLITNDGFTILGNLKFEDPVDNLVQRILLNAANETNINVGDGTTTTVILAAELSIKMLELVEKGHDPLELYSFLDRMLITVKKELKKNSKKISTKKQIADLAYISCRDKKLANKIADFCMALGKDGQRLLETNFNSQIETEIIDDGVILECDVVDAMFLTNQSNLTTEVEDCTILLSNKEIKNWQEFEPALKYTGNLGKKTLIILCYDISGSALQACKTNFENADSTIKIIPLKAPYAFEKQTTLLNDVAALTGGKLTDNTKGEALENLKFTSLGYAEKLVINPYRTIIYKGKKDLDKIKERLDQVNTLIKDLSFSKDLEFLFERKKYLTSRVGTFKVGAATKVEASEIYTRVEDALRNIEAAWSKGIIKGGGYALKDIVNKLYPQPHFLNTEGYEKKLSISEFEYSLYNSLIEPLKLIAKLNGIDQNTAIEAIGYDFRKKIAIDMYKAGITDSLLAVDISLETAFSIAKSLIFTENLILN